MPIPRLIYMPSVISRAMRLAIPFLSSMGSGFSGGSLFDSFFIMRALEAALNIYARRMDLIGIQLSGLDQLLDFCDGDFARRGHHGVEVAGRAAVDKVPHVIALPGLYDGVVSPQPAFHQIHF